MTDLKFLEGINKLESAFRVNKLSDASLKIYYEKLKEVDNEIWMQTIDRIIESEDFFPSIQCLLKNCGKEKSFNAAGFELKQL